MHISATTFYIGATSFCFLVAFTFLALPKPRDILPDVEEVDEIEIGENRDINKS